ncbi:MAG: hypothetical protein ACR2MX_11690 [Cyclobacteriaceae bacterium]
MGIVRLIFLCVIFLQSSACFGAELVLVGNYQGKNLYVQNPLLPDGTAYSSSEVYVNQDFLMHAPKASVFIIDLSHLELDQKVEVKILHEEDTPPKIVNAHVIRNLVIYEESSYASRPDVFRWAKADTVTLRWSVYNQKQGGLFVVERGIEKDWEAIDSLKITEATLYRFPISHTSGNNQYRIKLIDRDGYVSWSDSFNFLHKSGVQEFYPAKSKPEFDHLTGVSYYPKKAQRAIRLSKEAAYEVWSDDEKLLEGYGALVIIKNLSPGDYFIKIGEHKGAFTKY